MKESAHQDTLVSAEENRRMFDRVAAHYDAANWAMTLGWDRRWRRRAVDLLGLKKGSGQYLDVGTGTGDLAFEILDRSDTVLVTGIDPSENMLKRARKKALRWGRGDAVCFMVGDACALAFDADIFDGVILGFCFRNIAHRQRALDEFYRVLKRGARVVILEATVPENKLMRWGYCCYAKVLTTIARWLGDGKSYEYLMDSIFDFPPSDQVLEMFRQAGFVGVGQDKLAFGCVSVFYGEKA